MLGVQCHKPATTTKPHFTIASYKLFSFLFSSPYDKMVLDSFFKWWHPLSWLTVDTSWKVSFKLVKNKSNIDTFIYSFLFYWCLFFSQYRFIVIASLNFSLSVCFSTVWRQACWHWISSVLFENEFSHHFCSIIWLY